MLCMCNVRCLKLSPNSSHSASEVMVAQFHTMLFIILLGNGLNYTLGFCSEEYDGFARAIVWWPLTGEECSGEVWEQ